jgi:predicted TIM-barrel fold metal-dependent hydrolase
MTPKTPIRPGSPVAAEFWKTGRSRRCPVYNMHAHLGDFPSMYVPRAEPGDLVHSMDIAGVKLACFAHRADTMPEIGARPAIEAVRAFPDRLRAYLWVNPHYPELVQRQLSEYDDSPDVYVGLKVHPDSHEVPLTDERYRRAFEFAQERGLMVLSHTYDGSKFNGPEQVRRAVEKYTNIRFLMGHCLKSNWHEAAAIARDHPHVYLELTGVLGQWGAVDILCTEAGSQKILFGTDLPIYGHHQGIGNLLSADISDEDIHNICHRNAEKLLGVRRSTV